MLRPDPLRNLYRFYNFVNRFSRKLASPFSLVTSFVFYVRKLFLRHLRLEYIGDWGPLRRLRHSFYWAASRPHRWLKSGVARNAKKTYPIRALRRLISWFFRASFLEPVKWLIQIAGLVYSWGKTRKWLAIAVSGSPVLLLLATLLLDVRASRISKQELSSRYLEWAEAELGMIEESFDFSEVIRARLGETKDTEVDFFRDHRTGFSKVQSGSANKSSYGDMLFRRVHALSPGEQSCFVIGLTLLGKGADVAAEKILSRIAPDNQVKDYRAHGVMAAILLERIAATADESLFPVFQHHAAAGSRWRFIPPEVLAASAELHWRADEHERAFELLNIASEVRPEFFLLYHERALEAGFKPLADSIRERAIARFQRLLTQDPGNNLVRSNLAALYSTNPDGMLTAERILKEGEEIASSQVLSRALSEVYLKQLKLLASGPGKELDIVKLVDLAMAADASNPGIADFIAGLMKRHQGSTDRSLLVSQLFDALALGNATTGTHALLAEYYLQNNMRTQAVVHLEQVYRIAPTAAKFANFLAFEYARSDRLKDALAVANRSLSIISNKDLLSERYVDDLMDTLGKIYQKMEDWPEVIPVYELCLRMSPERSDTRLRLAKVYRITGRIDEADEQERLAKKSATMENRRKTLVQKLASPEMLLNQTLGVGQQDDPQSDDFDADKQVSPDAQPTTTERTPPQSPSPENGNAT